MTNAHDMAAPQVPDQRDVPAELRGPPELREPPELRVPAKLRWIAVWFRAVVEPAWRRAVAAWLGCTIVAAVLFGQTGMHPRDITGLALHVPGVGLVLGATWLLVFIPSARMLLRAEPAAYLASLPGNPRLARLITLVALIALQLPWLLMWLIGERALGLVVVLAMTIVIAGAASWRPPRVRPTFPAWRRAGQALRAIHLRALRRRAGDAMLRGAGLAVLAGTTAGLVMRNNYLVGETAGVFGAALIAVILVPAQIGTVLVTLTAHRETAWLAAATGIAPRTRTIAVVYAIAVVHVAASLIALAAAMIVAEPNGWLAILSLCVALGTAFGEARTLVGSDDSRQAATRTVVAAVVSGAIATVCLATLDAAGGIAVLATGSLLVLTVKS